jgi:hypothetical protein
MAVLAGKRRCIHQAPGWLREAGKRVSETHGISPLALLVRGVYLDRQVTITHLY